MGNGSIRFESKLLVGFFLMGFCFLACKSEPFEVQILAPSEVVAGEEAQISSKCTVQSDKTRFLWRAQWVPNKLGQRRCNVVLSDKNESEVKIKVDPNCEGGNIEVALNAEYKTKRAKAETVIKIVKKEEPVWPQSLPDTWQMINDYSSSGPNKLSGIFGTWGFKMGKCGATVKDGSLEIKYSLPLGDSSCGTYEHFVTEKGKAKPFDITPFEKIVFMMRSSDDSTHYVVFEIVEFDPYAEADQGLVSETRPLEVTQKWQRYEVNLSEVIHPHFNKKKAKQVGLRIDRKYQNQPSGAILFDNLVFVKKEEKGEKAGDNKRL
mgnify:CR=1 FL=1